jgi:predicted transcriptional regulator
MSQVKKVCGVGSRPDEEQTTPDYGFTCIVEDYAPKDNCASKHLHFNLDKSSVLNDSEVLMTLLSNKWRACDEIANILQMEPNLVQKSLDRLTEKGIIEFDEQELVYYRKMQK